MIKHGPGRGSCILGWDRRDDRIELGQCLRTRVGSYDLSPDGEHFVYSVDKFHYKKEHSAYTAVSRAPWLKALAFWSGDGTWGTHPSTGLFFRDDDRVLRLYMGRPCGLRWNQLTLPVSTTRPSAWAGFMEGFDRLQRDGWTAETELARVDRKSAAEIASWTGSSSIHRAVFRKVLCYGWALERTYWCGINRDDNRGISFETFALVSPANVKTSCADWTSADWDAPRQRIVWTADNQLFAAALDVRGASEPRLLYDARALGFVERKAPY